MRLRNLSARLGRLLAGLGVAVALLSWAPTGAGQLIAQATGVAAAFAWAFPVSLGIFLAIKHTVGLRVSEQEEMEGLDLSEHGMYTYPPSFVAGVGPSAEAAPAHLRVKQPVPAVQTG